MLAGGKTVARVRDEMKWKLSLPNEMSGRAEVELGANAGDGVVYKVQFKHGDPSLVST